MPDEHSTRTLATMMGALIIILQIVVADETIVGSDFDKVDQFDDKLGISHILVSTECISTCTCGALCGQEGERCKSFFFYSEENLCLLYSEQLDNLKLINKQGSKGYSVKHSSVTPSEDFSSTTSPTAATTSSTTDDTATSGNAATSATDSIATSTSVTTTESCTETSGEAGSGCTSTQPDNGSGGGSS